MPSVFVSSDQIPNRRLGQRSKAKARMEQEAEIPLLGPVADWPAHRLVLLDIPYVLSALQGFPDPDRSCFRSW